MSSPWIAYGQTTTIVNGTVVNPTTNHAGVIGEVSLPYTVPAGKELVIKSWSMEAYNNIPGGIVMYLWLGMAPITNGKCLHSVYAGDFSNQTTGFEYHIPAGTIVNANIQSNETAASVVGWFIYGELVDVAA